MNRLSRISGGISLLLLTVFAASGQRLGDEWTGRRGDLTPGLSYIAATQTGTGRIIAVSSGGGLMISDDNGSNWKFREIRVDGSRVSGGVSAIQAFGGATSVVALASVMTDAPGGRFAFAAKTTVLRSSDNGETWTSQPFPFDTADFLGFTFYGVNLTGLHVSPTGELIAYGTTTVSNQLFSYWSLGGLIYRSSNGSTWTQAKFAFGPLSKVANAGGRMVATGLSTALDSADGSGWNGYTMSNASISDSSGNQLSFENRRALWLLDVVVQGGNYVAQAAQFIPKDGFIDTGRVDAIYSLVSPNPFDGARSWTAYAQPRIYGDSFGTSSGIAAVGQGAYRTTSGQTWSVADATVRARGATVQTGASSLVAVGTSESAWRSTDSGSSWTKTWDPGVGPDLRVIGRFGGVVFATANDGIWASLDNGLTWELRAPGENGFGMVEIGGRLVHPGVGTQSVRVSDDLGFTWQTRNVGGDSSSGGFFFTETATGRLVMAAVGKNASNRGVFHVSDDNGETWAPRVAGLGFNETPRAIVTSTSGVIVVPTNTFASFNPSLVISNDNGETWTRSAVLQSLAGLDGVSGDPATKVLEVRRARASSTGRILLLGRDEILTSDDDGDSWRVRVNLSEEQVEDGFFNWNIWDVVQSGSRWLAIGSYRTPSPSNVNKVFALTSADDGATWKRVIVPTNQGGTVFQTLAVGADGRVVAGGTNGAIFSTDLAAPPPPKGPLVTVREGTTGQIEIARPPVPGEVTATFGAIQKTAIAGTDYVATSGELTWVDGDELPKTIALETIDNGRSIPERILALQITFETSDVKGQDEIEVSIIDNEGGSGPGIELEGQTALDTSEQGASATLKLALTFRPSADVTLTVSGLDPTEGRLSATSFVFTPDNWNFQQMLVITGEDDAEPDGDRAYDLRITASSADSAYANLLSEVVSVLNFGDEPYDQNYEPVAAAPPVPVTPVPTVAPSVDAPRRVIGKRGKAKIKGTLTGDIVRIEVKAGKGGFKNAKLRGNRFIYRARKLPDRRKVIAKVRATTADGQRIVEKVKIIFKPQR